ncbi:MAG: PQQ-dependent sugar dehydrogenase [Gammaproteobacteria bacterium]|jgi:glucose/arabinose dehydrogenase|nr:PQQ-dependent sugar dehydrogenase [Gammaproteobacteria bacterium]
MKHSTLVPKIILLLGLLGSGCSDPDIGINAPAVGSAATLPAPTEQSPEQPQEQLQEQPQESPGQAPPYHGSLPSLAAVNQRQAQLELVIDTLQQPWAFEFLNADEIIITEFAGSMQRLSLTDGQLSAIGGVPKVATNAQQTGLLDIALHPDFSRNQRLYFSYVISDPETGRYFKTVLDTATLVDDQLHSSTDYMLQQLVDSTNDPE